VHCSDYLRQTSEIALRLDPILLEAFVKELAGTRAFRGRAFIIGLGGSMANATHMAADLRKLCVVDAYSFDNHAELTARANDEGWDTIFTGWLRFMEAKDVLIVLSVGGGTDDISTPIIRAIEHARTRGAAVLGIVGPDGGYTAKHADIAIKIPAPRDAMTPHTEAFQAVIWHALVSHPLLQRKKTTW
jgi:D-sedoheptulose 7-phosphate isomerase